MLKKEWIFLNSEPTSIGSALRLLTAPSFRIWQQTAICPVSLRALVVELHLLNWTSAQAVSRISDILLNLLYGLETTSFQSGFKFGNQENVCWGYVRIIGWVGNNECLMFSQINVDERATREPAHCRSATTKSGFPTVQVSSCAQHPLNALKPPGTTVCLPSDHVVQIHDGKLLSNQKTQPTTSRFLNDLSVLFLVEEPFHTVLPVCLVKLFK
jgi:hypothetical protein